ncbi:MAG: DUF924 domain-containing protein [Rhodospirillales bacterium]|nr:DUF924 domain-containing protein [Rhodospirillales bacterium]
MTDAPSISPGIQDILDFWFLPLGHPDHAKPREIWWQSTPEFDAETVSRFGAAIEQAVSGGLDAWKASPEGALALILLCDQFPRNCFRKTARAFYGDAKALETARLALAHFYPSAFGSNQRLFFYMPFGHSEALADQLLACALFETIGGKENLQSAAEHRDVIARFGRFPHRNEVLGRASTAEELDYLRDAKRYGQ